MLIFFIVIIGLFKPVASQTLYEPVLVNNTILHDGICSEPHILLENCDKLFQEERTKLIAMGRHVNKLSKEMEISNLVLMALQRFVNVTGKI